MINNDIKIACENVRDLADRSNLKCVVIIVDNDTHISFSSSDFIKFTDQRLIDNNGEASMQITEGFYIITKARKEDI